VPKRIGWTTPKYKVVKVDTAARDMLLGNFDSANEIFEAHQTIDNWRDSHQYPCEIFSATLTRRAKKIYKDAIIAKRIKRLAAILAKLDRPKSNTMRLTQMNDIGGCRAIVDSISNVYKLVESYKKYDSRYNKYVGNQCCHPYDKYDYIKSPQETGYRGIHLVYKYCYGFNRESPYAAFNGLKVEIQIRTLLQHAWATAVETVDLFENQGLKFGKGTQEWKTFFRLASRAIAHIENAPLVKGTPTNLAQLKQSLKQYSHLINAIESLGKATMLLANIHTAEEGMHPDTAEYNILHLDISKKSVSVYSYEKNLLERAQAARSELELLTKDDPMQQVVMVTTTGPFADLQKAYPNYFLDISSFLKVIQNLPDSSPS
jgi:ppGpp synthetase/RelA/SpoT-type nucleotidyltranferase